MDTKKKVQKNTTRHGNEERETKEEYMGCVH